MTTLRPGGARDGAARKTSPSTRTGRQIPPAGHRTIRRWQRLPPLPRANPPARSDSYPPAKAGISGSARPYGTNAERLSCQDYRPALLRLGFAGSGDDMSLAIEGRVRLPPP